MHSVTLQLCWLQHNSVNMHGIEFRLTVLHQPGDPVFKIGYFLVAMLLGLLK